jgi:hypothetical protein
MTKNRVKTRKFVTKCDFSETFFFDTNFTYSKLKLFVTKIMRDTHFTILIPTNKSYRFLIFETVSEFAITNK